MVVHLIRQGGERRTIRKYGNGAFTVGHATVSGSVLVLPDSLKPWAVGHFAELVAASFADVLPFKNQIDVCLIGCGLKVARLPVDVRTYLKDAGLHVEVMDTGAACRTFNVLIAEGRALAAALIAV